MKLKSIIMLLMFTALFISGCSKERASDKFSGTYTVSDTWSSSKVGTGNLDYDMIIVPDGDEGIMLMNVNKTFSGVKAKVSDETITIPSQQISSNAGTKYTINGYTGKLKENKLDLTFVYSDALYGYAVGEVQCVISGTKQKSSSDK